MADAIVCRDMLEGYKVLNALRDLGEEPFTVDGVASRTGVKEATVRTVLGREKSLVVEDGRVETGRRGAQPKRFKLRAGAGPALAERLAEIESIGATSPDDGYAERALPSALHAAEATLLATGARGAAQLEHEATIGWLGFDTGTRALEASSDEQSGRLAMHLATVKALLGLIELERADADGSPIPDEQLEAARMLFAGVQQLDLDPALRHTLEVRLEQSSVGRRLAPPVVDVTFADDAADEITVLVMNVLSDQELAIQRTNVVSRALRRRPQFSVLVLGKDGGDVELTLGPPDEPVIVVDAFGERPELADRLAAEHHSTLYVSGLIEADLVRAIGFARGIGDSWLSVGERLLGG